MELERFTFFWRGPFSQWHPSKFELDGLVFNCAEQYMMYGKAMMFKDTIIANRIMASSNPSEQKRLGRTVRGFDLQRWNAEARDIVFAGNYAKFTQNEDLKFKLLDTVGTTLVEASPKDRIWGIGVSQDDPRALKRENWLGTNWLGETLTKVRNKIVEEFHA